jgi:hypothetical protein
MGADSSAPRPPGRRSPAHTNTSLRPRGLGAPAELNPSLLDHFHFKRAHEQLSRVMFWEQSTPKLFCDNYPLRLLQWGFSELSSLNRAGRFGENESAACCGESIRV